jgi:hypothetical protein
MRKRGAPTVTVTALGTERYLSRAARAQWSRDRVFFQIEELNALVAPLLRRSRPAEAEARLSRARARAAKIRMAVQWAPETTVPQVWAYLDTEVSDPEDLFGPAFLLQVLAPHERRTDALLGRISPAVGRLLIEIC